MSLAFSTLPTLPTLSRSVSTRGGPSLSASLQPRTAAAEAVRRPALVGSGAQVGPWVVAGQDDDPWATGLERFWSEAHDRDEDGDGGDDEVDRHHLHLLARRWTATAPSMSRTTPTA